MGRRSLISIGIFVIIFNFSTYARIDAKESSEYRRGFVFAVGAAYAPVVYWKRSKNNVDNLQQGWPYDYIFGWGVTGHDVIAFKYQLMDYKPKFLPGYEIAQGVIGLSWYHYFRATKPCWFTNIGFGYFSMNSSAHNVGHIAPQYQDFGRLGGDGWVGQIGFGRELLKYLQVAGYYEGGYSIVDGAKSTHQFLYVMVSGVLF